MADNGKNHFALLAMVAIVAIVGMTVLFLNMAKTNVIAQPGENVGGQAFVPGTMNNDERNRDVDLGDGQENELIGGTIGPCRTSRDCGAEEHCLDGVCYTMDEIKEIWW